ncbi:hypothetical protein [Streptomyces triculaminicus]|uniref:hypothetical protein n=1 Tax=Streptomyces triculaminicus TaxID=2816232 RepID=UPI0037D480FE
MLDDVADPADLGGVGGRLSLWPPARPYGRTVLTTRRRDAALPGRRIDQGLAGDTAGAAAALEELLGDYLRLLGPDHIETLGVRADLRRWRGEGTS